MPRMPVMDAAFSGAWSIAALLDAGLARPIPNPPMAMMTASSQKPCSPTPPTWKLDQPWAINTNVTPTNSMPNNIGTR